MNPEGFPEEQHPIVTNPELPQEVDSTSDVQPLSTGWDEYTAATLVYGKKFDADGNEVHYPWHLSSS